MPKALSQLVHRGIVESKKIEFEGRTIGIYPDTPPPDAEPIPEGWLTIKQYVAKYKISGSAVRRRIRGGAVEVKLVEGRPGTEPKKIIPDEPFKTVDMATETTDFPEGWLSIKHYASKYGCSIAKVKYLDRVGRLVTKRFDGPEGGIHSIIVGVLDVPLDQHPVKKTDLLHLDSVPGKRTSALSPSHQDETHKIRAPRPRDTKRDEKRKKRLLEEFLPRFVEKAPPDRMVFTTSELQEILGVSPTILHRDWRMWGLIGRDAPDDYKKLSTGVNLKGKKVYTRRDIVRFLQGEWDRIEQGTPDDVLIAAAEGVPALDGAYFNYDRAKIFPLNAAGFFEWLEEVDLQIENKRLAKWVTYRPWSIQKEAIEGALTIREDGDFKHKIAIFSAPRGDGKSMCKGTKVLMYDGTLKCVEDVIVGDLLMGPDSTPRKVLALGHGREDMYEVEPIKGDSFTCNASHILSLQVRYPREVRKKNKRVRRYSEFEVENIKLTDYIQKEQYYKDRAYLYRVPIDWPEQEVRIDPYWLGIWLSDGNTNGCIDITTNREDAEVLTYMRDFVRENGIDYTEIPDPRSKALRLKFRGEGGKKLRQEMQAYNLFGNKHIPHEYKANSREARLQILAGLIDGDGYVNRTGYEIIQKVRQLADDIAFIARSLGFFAKVTEVKKQIKSINFEGTYYKVSISGNCSVIPVKLPRKKVSVRTINKDVLRTRIKEIRPKGEGEYYGFMLDGDGLYLLEDFLVTHNTMLVSILTLFFFFNGYSETIILAGNTKDQSTFTHYDLCKSIIQHTPKLLRTPGLEVKEKYIALKSGPKEFFSSMRAVPTSVGLLPGTTRAIFTELHNLQDTKFFYDLWSSLRNVPNAMVLVDTTVARPGHLVHNLWQTFVKGEDPKIYFHHYADKHYNPEMTEEELNHFRQTMPEVLFNMYFRNRWEDAAGSLFPIERIMEMGVCGIDGKIAPPTPELTAFVKELREYEIKRNNYQRGGIDIAFMNREIAALERRLVPVSSLYKMPATGEDLAKIGRTFGCNFIIGVGLDRAMRQAKHPGRTVMSCVARGVVTEETSLYFILDIYIPQDQDTLPNLADKYLEWSREYGWIDKVAIESYMGQDFYDWVSDKALKAEKCSPTYAAQRPVFFSMSNIVDSGQIKCPPVPYYTDDEGRLYRGFTNKNDVFREEMEMFNFIPGETEKTGKFGSPEKHKKSGVQDDTIYSVGWAIYATHGDDLVPSQRGGGAKIISAVVNQDVYGVYK